SDRRSYQPKIYLYWYHSGRVGLACRRRSRARTRTSRRLRPFCLIARHFRIGDSCMTTTPPSSRRHVQVVPFKPTLSWMSKRLARIVAFGFGSGLLTPAPGTWGTLAAWLLWWVGIGHFAPWGVALLLILGFLYGSWACGTVGQEMGAPDHGGMVWDEMIAFWLVLWVIPNDLF